PLQFLRQIGDFFLNQFARTHQNIITRLIPRVNLSDLSEVNSASARAPKPTRQRICSLSRVETATDPPRRGRQCAPRNLLLTQPPLKFGGTFQDIDSHWETVCMEHRLNARLEARREN